MKYFLKINFMNKLLKSNNKKGINSLLIIKKKIINYKVIKKNELLN